MRGYQLPIAKTPLHSEKQSARAWRKSLKRRRKKKKKRARKQVKYFEYMESAKWKRKARKFKKKAGCCQSCSTKSWLTVHHLHYKSLGFEKFKDVEVLCWPCHQQRHEDKMQDEHIRHIAKYG